MNCDICNRVINIAGQGSNVGTNLVLLIRVNHIATAEFQKDLACEVVILDFNRRWITEPDFLATIIGPQLVLTVSSKCFGRSDKGWYNGLFQCSL